MATPCLHETTTARTVAEALDEHLLSILDAKPPESEDEFTGQIIDAIRECCQQADVQMTADEFATLATGIYVGLRIGRTIPNAVSD